MTLKAPGCPIRISPDQRLLPPPRGFSQSATSFIASRCQGIHQMPLSRLRPLPCTGTNPSMDRELNDGHIPQPLGESTTSGSDQTGPKPRGHRPYENPQEYENPKESSRDRETLKTYLRCQRTRTWSPAAIGDFRDQPSAIHVSIHVSIHTAIPTDGAANWWR